MNPDPENSAATPGPVTEATLDKALRAVWPGLRAYVVSMLGPHRHLAEDVMQETALFVWEKRAELPGVRNFDAWVFRSAYFKTLSLRRDLVRRKETLIGDELFEKIAAAAGEETGFATEARLTALVSCIEAVPAPDRELLDWRYRDNRTLVEIAPMLKQAVNTLHQRVSRLRRALRNCVEHKLAAGHATH